MAVAPDSSRRKATIFVMVKIWASLAQFIRGQPENQKGPTSWEPHGKGPVPLGPPKPAIVILKTNHNGLKQASTMHEAAN
jgi:hypothetical protein